MALGSPIEQSSLVFLERRCRVSLEVLVMPESPESDWGLSRAEFSELETQLAYVETISSLAQLVEAKDATTHDHLGRTRAYGLALARRIDPAMAALPEVGYGFFLHDVGKIGVPESILCKPGPLTGPEWQIMRAHPRIGARIVAPIEFLAGAVEIIASHHERFDGTGYPLGLRGGRIPMAARIFSVVDAFDAMTSDRPYRRAMPMLAALEEIRSGSGTQFDPEVVDAFLSSWLEGELDLLADCGIDRVDAACEALTG